MKLSNKPELCHSIDNVRIPINPETVHNSDETKTNPAFTRNEIPEQLATQFLPIRGSPFLART